jgi:uncharacterized repeat protein (TIGR03803 family)
MTDRASVSFRFVLALALSVLCSASAYGATEKILHSFNGTLVHGSTPESALIKDASGNLYGTTYYGGANSLGAVFKLTPTLKGGWTQMVLYSFKGGSDGSSPAASLVFDALGNLYGTTTVGGTGSCSNGGAPLGCGTVFKLAPTTHGSWTETVLYSFQGTNDGVQPTAALIFDSAGNLYGTTVSGGRTPYSRGTIFKLSPSSGGAWTESILYSFTGLSDGSMPVAPLIFDASGNLYGTTGYGGTSSNGVVFEFTPNAQGTWSESVLYNFAGGTDGSTPGSPLIFDSAGNLYGTTYRGGGFTGGAGTVFELKPNGNGAWTESILYRFGITNSDGLYPSGVIFDDAGNLYGTTSAGGNTGCYNTGCGVAFRLSPNSGGQWTESILHTFTGGADGGNPYAGVIFDHAGNFYGTTAYGGLANLGAVFKLSQRTGGSFTEKTLYWFPGTGGWFPAGNLIADGAGNFYGTAERGGLYQNGAVFKLSPNSHGGWTSSLIYNFKGVPDGSGPVGSLVFDTAGNLYGASGGGGTGVCGAFVGCGTVFKLSPGSGQWTETVLHSFTGGADGTFPYAGVTFSGGNLFGTTYLGGGNGSGCKYLGCGVIYEMSPASGGWKETIAYTFTGGLDDGGMPEYAALTADAAGNLYGTTTYTGCDGCAYPYPTVFELSPNGTGGWSLNTLYVFLDYGFPLGSLVLDSAGNIFGTTYSGVYGSVLPAGSVFELTKSGGTWSRNTLYGFTGGSDGKYPIAGVTFDPAGSLYGTTSEGGNSVCGASLGCGVVYKLVPGSGGSWSFSVLHTFDGSPGDGGGPEGGVTIDSLGNLYGTTVGGGSIGYGTVYEVTP